MMHGQGGCCDGAGSDCGVAGEFVRPRFYYGQRLGVVELSDQVAYHAGKMSFHNRRLHGWGILCGLMLERMEYPVGVASTVLRVRTGAGLDACGREVVVPVDQCVDTAAFWARVRNEEAYEGYGASSKVSLFVGLRYRERSTDPAPAPKDPCGCEPGCGRGYELTRIHEGFELKLLPKAEVLPTLQREDLRSVRKAIANPGPDADAWEALLKLRRACPIEEAAPWLVLGRVELALDASRNVVGLTLDADAFSRRELLPSQWSDTILQMLVEVVRDPDQLLPDPTWSGAIELASATATGGTLVVPLRLRTMGGAPVELLSTTFSPSSVALKLLDPAVGWVSFVPSNVSLDTTPGANALRIEIGGLAPPSVLRLCVLAPPTDPLIDKGGFAVSPTIFSRTLRFSNPSGVLALESILK